MTLKTFKTLDLVRLETLINEWLHVTSITSSDVVSMQYAVTVAAKALGTVAEYSVVILYRATPAVEGPAE